MKNFILLFSLMILLLVWSAGQVTAQHGEESNNMRLLAHNDLQGRSAYQPLVQFQRGRFIAYVGHHGGSAFNPLTGKIENNGTSIVDVTDPRNPVYLHHIPGPSGVGEAGGAQMVQTCDGSILPKGVPGKTYLLRAHGSVAHQVYDVTDPGNPVLLSTPVDGLAATHKNWWECDTGIAYLVSDGRPFGWRTNRMTQIFDLSDPANPVFIRNFGLVGQEPGSTVEPVPEGLHEPVRLGDRLYMAYGTSSRGVFQIVDREKLLNGDPNDPYDPLSPTPAQLLFPQIGRLDMAPFWGGHTAFPLIGVEIADYAGNRDNRIRDFVVLVSESTANECQETRHIVSFVDITVPEKPYPVSTFQVPESSGNFCSRGGRFGPHASNWSFNPLFYKRIQFISYFNAGVRAVDIRDPFNPREIAFFIPATTENTDPRGDKIAIQTNNVELDDRGLIYLADRANTGLHIVDLTGPAGALVNLP